MALLRHNTVASLIMKQNIIYALYFRKNGCCFMLNITDFIPVFFVVIDKLLPFAIGTACDDVIKNKYKSFDLDEYAIKTS